MAVPHPSRSRCSVMLHAALGAGRVECRRRALRPVPPVRARPVTAGRAQPGPLPAAAAVAAADASRTHRTRPRRARRPERRPVVDARLLEPAPRLPSHPPRRRARDALPHPHHDLPGRPRGGARPHPRRVRGRPARRRTPRRRGAARTLGRRVRPLLAAHARRARGRHRLPRPPDRAIGPRRHAERADVHRPLRRRSDRGRAPRPGRAGAGRRRPGRHPRADDEPSPRALTASGG